MKELQELIKNLAKEASKQKDLPKTFLKTIEEIEKATEKFISRDKKKKEELDEQLTEIKRLDDELIRLKDNDLHARYFYEYSNDIIYRLDIQGFYTFINSAGHHVLQYKNEEFIGKHYLDFIHPDYRQMAQEAYLQQFMEKTVNTYIEYPVIAKDETEIWLEHNVQLIVEDEWRIGFQGISRDISLRKLAEDTLRKAKDELEYRVKERTTELEKINLSLKREIEKRMDAEEELQQQRAFTENLIENLAVAVFVLDQDHKVMLWNHSSEVLTGYKSKEFIGTKKQWKAFYKKKRPTLADIVLDKEFNSLSNLYQVTSRSVLESHGWHGEGWYDDIGGQKRYMIFDAVPIFNKEGDIIAAVETLQDITVQKNAEQEMQRMQSLLKNIINSMPSIIVGVDNNLNVIQWNLRAEEILGIKEKYVQGKFIADVYPFLRDYLPDLKIAISKGEPQKIENLFVEEFNSQHYYDILIYPLISNGVQGAVIRIDDITSRVLMEEMMVQTEKMMSVGGLAAGMAHEINNPLSGILMGAQNIKRRLGHNIEKNIEIADKCGVDLFKIQEYLHRRDIDNMLEGIISMADRASKIVYNMLSFSRKSDAKQKSCSVVDLIDNTIEIAANDYDLKKKYDFRHIKIDRNYEKDLPEINCSPTELQQVFLNLFKNSAQAMSQVQYDHKVPEIGISVTKEKDMIIIRIKDNGPGMDEKTKKRIFEPFFTTKSTGLGTGLGLSVSYFIITNNHNGKMVVDSKVNEGAVFTLSLPYIF